MLGITYVNSPPPHFAKLKKKKQKSEQIEINHTQDGIGCSHKPAEQGEQMR
jgi:hypothetical protein